MLLLLCSMLRAAVAGEGPHHVLEVALDPENALVRVTDTVTLPGGVTEATEFVLGAGLTLTAAEPHVEALPGDGADPTRSAGEETVEAWAGPRRYRVLASAETLRLEYEGPIRHPLDDPSQEISRGYRATRGLVAPEGVFLAGESAWYPRFGDTLLTFEMAVDLPDGWHVISQGRGTSRDGAGRARWRTRWPTDEIYLVGGPLTAHPARTHDIETGVYLHAPDPALAGRYLEATARYLAMYGKLIGPYPYAKFVLVENFWETGFGMPSFTLLGPRVIRFPFILTTSYPHEILHNWWGNSVLVDYATGNWAEGLTAYLADHLLRAQRGQGAAYRRDTLQKYRSYVRGDLDFPLTAFRARHDAATAAVGYGKTMMGFHMLRLRLGDAAFRKGLARLYAGYRGRRASFTDVRTMMERVSGQDLARFFRDWVERPGAAALEVGGVAVDPVDDGRGWRVRGTLRQGQLTEPYLLDVPIAVQTAKGAEVVVQRMAEREREFAIEIDARPLALHVDPRFDLFRGLDPREVPPSVGQLFGAERPLVVLPADASPEARAAYRALAETWRSTDHAPEFILDSDADSLPEGRAAWLLGRENRLVDALLGPGVTRDALAVDGTTIPLVGHAVVLVRRPASGADHAVGWIVADDLAALPGLARKLPHYGKYSYLAFEGPAPTNVLKGQWNAADSPLRIDLRPAAERSEPLPPLALPAREPLIGLPPEPSG